MRDHVPARSALRLRALLRTTRGQLPPRALRRRRGAAPAHPGRATGRLALRRLPAARRRAARTIEPSRLQGRVAGRLDAADQRGPARRSARPAGGVGQERRCQPDSLVQGSRRGGRLGASARAGLWCARLRVDREPRQRRRRPGSGARAAVLRLHPVRSRGAEGPRHRRLRHQPGVGSRQLRRGQPPVHGAVGRARGLGLRQHQHAPVLLGGFQDRRVRDRRAARLGASRPLHRPDRLGIALHEGSPRLCGVDRTRAGRGPTAGDERGSGCGLRAGRNRVRRWARTSASRSGPTRSPSRWRLATRPTGPTSSTSHAAPGAASMR